MKRIEPINTRTQTNNDSIFNHNPKGFDFLQPFWINLALLWFQPAQAHSKANPKSAYSFFWSQSKASGSPWKPFVTVLPLLPSVSKIENPTLKKACIGIEYMCLKLPSKGFLHFPFTPSARRVQHRIKEDSSWKQFFLCSRSISEVSPAAKHVMHLWFRSEISAFTTLSALGRKCYVRLSIDL